MCYWFKLNVEDILLYGLLFGSAWLEKHCESLLPIVEKNLLDKMLHLLDPCKYQVHLLILSPLLNFSLMEYSIHHLI